MNDIYEGFKNRSQDVNKIIKESDLEVVLESDMIKKELSNEI